MSMVDRHNSTLHDSDNRYHTNSDCRQEDNVKRRRGHGASLPSSLR